MRISTMSEGAAIAEATDFAAGWDQFKQEDKRQLVELITDKIVVGKEEVAINLLYLPTAVRVEGQAHCGLFHDPVVMSVTLKCDRLEIGVQNKWRCRSVDRIAAIWRYRDRAGGRRSELIFDGECETIVSTANGHRLTLRTWRKDVPRVGDIGVY
jgi:hypothetical protein